VYLSPLLTSLFIVVIYSFSHPYEFELEHFTPSDPQLEHREPHMYKPLEETSLIMVNHADQLPDLLKDLANYSEIAVDLEVSRSQEQ
jgi:exosome complex exonuclease RRP6